LIRWVLPSRRSVTWLVSRVGGIDGSKAKKQTKTLRFQDEEIEEEKVFAPKVAMEGYKKGNRG
jgi:hypothetical protein